MNLEPKKISIMFIINFGFNLLRWMAASVLWTSIIINLILFFFTSMIMLSHFPNKELLKDFGLLLTDEMVNKFTVAVTYLFNTYVKSGESFFYLVAGVALTEVISSKFIKDERDTKTFYWKINSKTVLLRYTVGYFLFNLFTMLVVKNIFILYLTVYAFTLIFSFLSFTCIEKVHRSQKSLGIQ